HSEEALNLVNEIKQSLLIRRLCADYVSYGSYDRRKFFAVVHLILRYPYQPLIFSERFFTEKSPRLFCNVWIQSQLPQSLPNIERSDRIEPPWFLRNVGIQKIAKHFPVDFVDHSLEQDIHFGTTP